jgi:lipopolysaccharide export system protein LptA
VLEGQPATLGQDLDDGGRLDARARVIDYDVASGIVVLTGAVEIDQPRGSLRGERVTYDLNTGQLTGGGEGVPGRVSLRINPKPAAGGD